MGFLSFLKIKIGEISPDLAYTVDAFEAIYKRKEKQNSFKFDSFVSKFDDSAESAHLDMRRI